MLSLILLFPLAGFLVNGLFGRRMPASAVALIGCLAPALSCVAAAGAFEVVAQTGHPLSETLWRWLDSGRFRLTFGLEMGRASGILALIVTGVGFLIHVYSIGYMRGDEGFARYFAYLNFFTFAMLVLVLADSLPLLFLGWEGVGLASYLLIGFWFKNEAYAFAGRKAFVVNRIGDLGFLLGMFVLYAHSPSLRFSDLLSEGNLKLLAAHGLLPVSVGFWFSAASLASTLLFVGAMGKSAQIPLHIWLPDAMAGPTPVSALIHAATMVTAGVYLVVRMSPLFQCAGLPLEWVAKIGALTAFLAATAALVQNDIKKILAYSTISQLGYMFLAAGSGLFGGAFFHVTTHAFFKALLFLAAGSVIAGLHHRQDLREMGGLWRRMPFTALAFLVGALALSGIPPFAGYYSKEFILEGVLRKALEPGGSTWAGLFVLGTLSAFLTALYSFRAFARAFLGRPRHPDDVHPRESRGAMLFVLLVLILLSAAGGRLFGSAEAFSEYVESDPALRPGRRVSQSQKSAAPLPDPKSEIRNPKSNHALERLPLAAALLGAVLGLLVYTAGRPLAARLAAGPAGGARHILENAYYMDRGLTQGLGGAFLRFARALFAEVDAGIIDRAVEGTGHGALRIGAWARGLQTGRAGTYATAMALGAIALLAYAFFVME